MNHGREPTLAELGGGWMHRPSPPTIDQLFRQVAELTDAIWRHGLTPENLAENRRLTGLLDDYRLKKGGYA